MFIETSAPRRQGDKARLMSPTYTDSTAICVKFWYHMYGNGVGTLNVYAMVSYLYCKHAKHRKTVPSNMCKISRFKLFCTCVKCHLCLCSLLIQSVVSNGSVADSESPDHTVRMCRLNWTIAVCIYLFSHGVTHIIVFTLSVLIDRPEQTV